VRVLSKINKKGEEDTLDPSTKLRDLYFTPFNFLALFSSFLSRSAACSASMTLWPCGRCAVASTSKAGLRARMALTCLVLKPKHARSALRVLGWSRPTGIGAPPPWGLPRRRLGFFALGCCCCWRLVDGSLGGVSMVLVDAAAASSRVIFVVCSVLEGWGDLSLIVSGVEAERFGNEGSSSVRVGGRSWSTSELISVC